jgi:hypothetical protein
MAIGMPQQGGFQQPLEAPMVQQGGSDYELMDEQEGGGPKQYNTVVSVRKLG